MKLEELVRFVQSLHDNDAIHKKRGFRLKGVSPTLITNHLLEEVVELQAEAAIEGHHNGIVEEAADTLAVFLHLLNTVGIDIQEVVDKCYEKLDDVFTYDEDEVLTDTPGFTRRHRKGSGSA